jgi:hypothetical protein
MVAYQLWFAFAEPLLADTDRCFWGLGFRVYAMLATSSVNVRSHLELLVLALHIRALLVEQKPAL